MIDDAASSVPAYSAALAEGHIEQMRELITRINHPAWERRHPVPPQHPGGG
jgi:hypothetical protein